MLSWCPRLPPGTCDPCRGRLPVQGGRTPGGREGGGEGGREGGGREGEREGGREGGREKRGSSTVEK